MTRRLRAIQPVKHAPYVHGLADQTCPDISRADFTWCMTAISWGRGIEETAARLIEESAKAGENGEAYALLTRKTPPPIRATSSGAGLDRCPTAPNLLLKRKQP